MNNWMLYKGGIYHWLDPMQRTVRDLHVNGEIGALDYRYLPVKDDEYFKDRELNIKHMGYDPLVGLKTIEPGIVPKVEDFE